MKDEYNFAFNDESGDNNNNYQCNSNELVYLVELGESDGDC